MYDLPPCTINKNGFIRIRAIKDLLNSKNKIILCSKKIISQGKTRQNEEHEIEVNNLNECKNLLDSLNLNFTGIQKKYRESYKYMGCLVEFDTWDKNIYPDTYIEIEVIDGNNIYDILKSLDIPEKNATSKSLHEIIADKKAANLM